MKRLLIILLLVGAIIWLLTLTSCSRWCDPQTISSGRSSQHHDGKKFKAMIRVKYIDHVASVYVVKFENMKHSYKKTYHPLLPANIIVGEWVPEDSI